MGQAWATGLTSLMYRQHEQNIVINFHQDFVDSIHSDFFQGQTDRGLYYWPNQYHSVESQLSKQEQEVIFYIG